MADRSGENNCQTSQELLTGKILKISYARCHFVKCDISFLGLSQEIFFGVNYTYRP